MSKKKLVLAIEFYIENGWYGDRYRFIFSGMDGEGFKTKSEAGKYSSMLKKYLKNRNKDYVNGQVSAAELEKYKTYIYMGAGPSYSCKNLNVNVEEFSKFIEKENARLEEGREMRKSMESQRQTRSERFKSMRRGKEARRKTEEISRFNDMMKKI